MLATQLIVYNPAEGKVIFGLFEVLFGLKVTPAAGELDHEKVGIGFPVEELLVVVIVAIVSHTWLGIELIATGVEGGLLHKVAEAGLKPVR